MFSLGLWIDVLFVFFQYFKDGASLFLDFIILDKNSVIIWTVLACMWSSPFPYMVYFISWFSAIWHKGTRCGFFHIYLCWYSLCFLNQYIYTCQQIWKSIWYYLFKYFFFWTILYVFSSVTLSTHVLDLFRLHHRSLSSVVLKHFSLFLILYNIYWHISSSLLIFLF